MGFNALSPWHLIILVVVLVVVFGSKKLPDAARSLGKSMRIFKSEIKEMQSDGKGEDDANPRDGDAAKSPTPIASERADQPPAPEKSPEQRSA